MPAQEPSDADRRVHERIPARIEIRFDRHADAARALRAYSLNFSVGGLCIRTRHPYQVGATVEIAMTVAGEDFAFPCTVAWVRGDAAGLRFEGVSTEDKNRLQSLVANLKK